MTQFGGTQSATDIRTDYLKLLTTQLANQNPLDPLDNQDMASQLAQLSQLDQIEGIRKSFDQVLADQKRIEAASLIGKEVTFFVEGSDTPVTGVVDSVDLTGSEVMIQVGQWALTLDAIQQIHG